AVTGAAFGALNGLHMGLSETKNMALSKPTSFSQSNGILEAVIKILNLVTRQGATWANTPLWSVFWVAIEKTQGAEDDINTVAAGTMTGMLYKST
ncbi:unnamed protein product, partial [Coregonus sp. 'balchen']